MNKGYTLLELLLVLVIILILTSNAIAAYHRAKNAAKEAKCNSYRRQMELIQSMPEFDYTIDYGEHSDFSSVVDEMVLMYNQCYKCHEPVTDNDWRID